MTLSELDQFFIALDPSKRRPGGRDGIKWGDPEAEVGSVATTWLATLSVIRRAAALDCNVIVTHEPTFYWDDVDSGKAEYDIAAAHGTSTEAKRKLLEEEGLAVIRMHDAWDFYPDYGIADSLARSLNWRNRLSDPEETPVFGLHSVPVGDVARHVKTRLRLRALRIVGDMSADVTKVAILVGAFGGLPVIQRAMGLGVECVIGGECSEWQVVRFCEDAGLPMILLGHAESETPGMTAMAALLRDRLGLTAHAVPTGQTFVVL